MTRPRAPPAGPRSRHRVRPVSIPAAATALLLIDVIKDLALEGSEAPVEQAGPQPPMSRASASTQLRPLASRLPPDNGSLHRSRSISPATPAYFTANDAYLREFKLFTPSDCIVSNTTADNEYALRQLEAALKSNPAPSGSDGRRSPSGCTRHTTTRDARTDRTAR